ncbi:MAG: hypothetical protein JXR94_02625 [Candidatus Hydrogenedentes bacterium]|nr:hypothetical protein [Candidatus Hydrogenedentota bacterium]
MIASAFLFVASTIVSGSAEADADAPTAEELLGRCYAREEGLASGHVEVSCARRGRDGTALESEDLYLEWDSSGRFRLGLCDGDESLLCVSDGKTCLTRDGTRWDRRFIGNDAFPASYLDAAGPSAREALTLAAERFVLLHHWFLFPLSSGRELSLEAVLRSDSFGPDTELRDALAIEDDDVLLRGAKHRIPLASGSGPRNYSVLYAVDPERGLITGLAYDTDGDAAMQVRWEGAVKVADGVWMPERMVIHGGREGQPDTVVQLDAERTWLGPVAEARFRLGTEPPRQPIAWPEDGTTDESLLIAFLDHGVEPVLDLVIRSPLVSLMLASAGVAFLVWRRRGRATSGTQHHDEHNSLREGD